MDAEIARLQEKDFTIQEIKDDLANIMNEIDRKKDRKQAQHFIRRESLNLLRLQFQKEEIGANPDDFVETVDTSQKQYYLSCCDYIPKRKPQRQVQKSHSNYLNKYLENNDFQELKDRSQSLHWGSIEWIHLLLNSIIVGKDSILWQFFLCFVCPLHIITWMISLPIILIYNCSLKIANYCYRSSSRTEKIVRIIQKYNSQQLIKMSDEDLENLSRITKEQEEKLKLEIQQKKKVCRKDTQTNTKFIAALNDELKLLMEQFQEEEKINQISPLESIGKNKDYCCYCFSINQENPLPKNATANGFQYYWKVESTADFYHKMRKLEERSDNLMGSGCDCWRGTKDVVVNGIPSAFCVRSNSPHWVPYGFTVFSFLFVCCLLPIFPLMECGQWCGNFLYRRKKRTTLLLELYQKYQSNIKEVYI